MSDPKPKKPAPPPDDAPPEEKKRGPGRPKGSKTRKPDDADDAPKKGKKGKKGQVKIDFELPPDAAKLLGRLPLMLGERMANNRGMTIAAGMDPQAVAMMDKSFELWFEQFDFALTPGWAYALSMMVALGSGAMSAQPLAKEPQPGDDARQPGNPGEPQGADVKVEVSASDDPQSYAAASAAKDANVVN